MEAAVNWNAISAVSGVAVVAGGVVGLLWKFVLKEVRDQVREIVAQVTPNGGNTDTIGDRVVRIEENQRVHAHQDDARFAAVWEAIGRQGA